MIKLSQDYNLKCIYPDVAKEWDYEKNNISPSEVTPYSAKKVWWMCSKGHSYESTIASRTSVNKTGCPYCSGRKIGYGNDLKTRFPDVLKEWDYEKNNISPSEVTPYSAKKVWWMCSKGHSHHKKVGPKVIEFNRYSGTGCGDCSKEARNYIITDLKTRFPDVAKEWDYEKNSLKPEEYPSKSSKKVWWICSKGHSYETKIKTRTAYNSGCPYCANLKIGYGNDLKSNYPDIAKEWDYEKNNISASEVAPHTGKKYWWICPNDHSYEVTVATRTTNNTGCPYCSLTPRSKEEIYLLFELKNFFNIDEDDHKIKLDKIHNVDIKIYNEKIVIEYDGHYWHKDKITKDISKTSILFNNGWTVIRVREKPLKILSKKYDVNSKPQDYKVTANKVLKRLAELGFDIPGLNKYIKRKTLINKKEADIYIDKLLMKKDQIKKKKQIKKTK